MPRLSHQIPARLAEQVRSLWFAKIGTSLTINGQLMDAYWQELEAPSESLFISKRLNARLLQIDGAYHAGGLPSWHICLGTSLQRLTPGLPRMVGAYAELERSKGRSMTSLQPGSAIPGKRNGRRHGGYSEIWNDASNSAKMVWRATT